MKILHYVDENRLAWGETWIQLIKELTIQGTDNFIVCRPGGTLAARLQEEGLNFETAAPVVQALPFTNTALGRILKRENRILSIRAFRLLRLSAAGGAGVWGFRLWRRSINIRN